VDTTALARRSGTCSRVSLRVPERDPRAKAGGSRSGVNSCGARLRLLVGQILILAALATSPVSSLMGLEMRELSVSWASCAQRVGREVFAAELQPLGRNSSPGSRPLARVSRVQGASRHLHGRHSRAHVREAPGGDRDPGDIAICPEVTSILTRLACCSSSKIGASAHRGPDKHLCGKLLARRSAPRTSQHPDVLRKRLQIRGQASSLP
jgi:hypothetical protein